MSHTNKDIQQTFLNINLYFYLDWFYHGLDDVTSLFYCRAFEIVEKLLIR